MKDNKRLQELAGIKKELIKESPKEPGFTTVEFDNDLEVNTENDGLFQELSDPENKEH